MENKVATYSDIKKIVWIILDLLRSVKQLDNFEIIAFILFIKKENIVNKLCWRFENDSILTVIDGIKDVMNDFHRQFKSEIADELIIVFSNELLTINKNILIEAFYLIDQIDNELYQLYSGDIIDEVFLEIAKRTGKKSDTYIQPFEITQIINSLIDLPSEARIYNPFAGLASFGVGIKSNIHYYAQEINKKIWALGTIRLLAHNMNPDLYVCEDSIYNWMESYPTYDPFRKVKGQDHKFDLLVSTPPFNIRLDYISQRSVQSFARTAEEFLLTYGINCLNNEGKMVLVVPNGILNNGNKISVDIRKGLIERDLLEMVISLPSGLFDATGIFTSILIFNKNKKSKNTVKVVNGESFYKQDKSRKTLLVDNLLQIINSKTDTEFSKVVINSDILENDSNLTPGIYFSHESVIPDGFKTLKLKSIISLIRRDVSHKDQFGRFIRIGDLSNDPIDYETSFADLETVELNQSTSKLSDNALLISRISLKLKPTYYINDKSTSVYLNSNIWAFSVKEELVDIPYLINELYSDYVSEQINLYSAGSSISFLPLENFLSINILIPILKTQKEIIDNVRRKIIFDKELELKVLKDKFEQQTYEEFASLKHALGKPIPGITTAIEYIFEFLQNNEGNPIYLDSVVSNRRPVTLRDKFNTISNGLKLIRTLLKNGDKGFILEEYPLQNCKIVQLVKQFCNSYTSDKFSVSVYDNSMFEDAEIFANNDLVTILLNDVLSNANNHAFKDFDIEKNKVDFFLSITDNNLYLMIENNGLPFPVNFDESKFIKKYQKAGENSGAGIGGYDINRICKYCKGTFNLVTEPMDGYNVIYQFIFPIIDLKDNTNE